MDTRRLILLVIFSFSLLMLWQAWQKEFHPVTLPSSAQQTLPGAQNAPGGSVPSGTSALPNTASNSPPSGTVPAAPAAGVPASAEDASRARPRIRVETDLVAADIDPLGGDIVRLELLQHKDTTDPTKNFVLLGPEYRYTAQSGFTGAGLPNHRTLYSASASDFKLASGKDKLEVRLEASGTGGADGVKAAKILTFHRGSYVVDITHELTNNTQAPINTSAYFHLTRNDKAPPGDTAMLQTFTGAAVYTEANKYQKLSWSDLDKGKTPYPKEPQTSGWVALVQHYFVSALAPAEGIKREFYTERIADEFYRAGLKVPVQTVAPGGAASVTVPLYAGPQEQDDLRALAPGLDLVVDYGWLTVIAAPLFWVLKYLHKLVGNWGWAIVLLTVLIKLIFFPLSAASYRSMAKMKLVTPRLTKLREQYGDDRMKLNQAMMEMYKTEKINPLGGCLPIVVQIPVFIALYWVLLGSVELRQAPFIGWIRDLSAPDPWFVLPVLMLISMVAQTRMNPTPPDPVQAKVMMIMPFVFGIMFFWFPAGLVLYWFVNNILSIAQQWQITRMMGDGKAKPKKA